MTGSHVTLQAIFIQFSNQSGIEFTVALDDEIEKLSTSLMSKMARISNAWLVGNSFRLLLSF